MGANSSRKEPIGIGMDRPGQQYGDVDVENGGSPNETTPAIEPARFDFFFFNILLITGSNNQFQNQCYVQS